MNLDQRIADLMGARPLRFQAARGGYSTADRGVVFFDNGQSAFVKAATDEMTAAWLRTEYAVYEHLATTPGVDFLPDVLAWDDDGSRPLLILEDLSGAHWPPPWEQGLVERVQEVLSRLRRVTPMPGMVSLESHRDDLCGWRKVAEDPQPFLSLGLCDPSWLDAALPTLTAAEAGVRLAGDDFLHLDIRSNNLCFTPDRTILVDWNWACVGNGEFDLASWLPSLHSEGGPPPESLLPDAPEMAAALSGFWAAGAGLPRPEARQMVPDVATQGGATVGDAGAGEGTRLGRQPMTIHAEVEEMPPGVARRGDNVVCSTPSTRACPKISPGAAWPHRRQVVRAVSLTSSLFLLPLLFGLAPLLFGSPGTAHPSVVYGSRVEFLVMLPVILGRVLCVAMLSAFFA